MNLIDIVMSQLFSFVVLGLTVSAVVKLFQVSTALNEIKDLLADIKRNSSGSVPRGTQPAPASPADLMRAVNDEGMDAAELYAQNLLRPPRA